MKYHIVGLDGQIIRTVSCPEDQIACQLTAGESFVQVDEHDPIRDDTHYFDGKSFVQIPAQPSPELSFDYATKAWADLRTPEQAKAQEEAEADIQIAAIRASVEDSARAVLLAVATGTTDQSALDKLAQADADINTLAATKARSRPASKVG